MTPKRRVEPPAGTTEENYGDPEKNLTTSSQATSAKESFALVPDPMLEFARTKLGQTIPGRVSQITPIGVFVRVADGLEGLVFPRRPADELGSPQRGLQVNDDVLVTVRRVNAHNRQIGLTLEPEENGAP